MNDLDRRIQAADDARAGSGERLVVHIEKSRHGDRSQYAEDHDDHDQLHQREPAGIPAHPPPPSDVGSVRFSTLFQSDASNTSWKRSHPKGQTLLNGADSRL